MYKENLVLNSLPWLVCYKIQPNQSNLIVEINFQFRKEEKTPQVGLVIRIRR